MECAAVTSRAWRDDNREWVRERYRKWARKNPEKMKKKSQNRYSKNKDNPEFRAKVIAWRRVWREKNREEVRKYSRRWNREKYRSDTNFRLRSLLRHRLWTALSETVKTGSAIRDLGCSVDELKAHIEDQFQPGMTWDNWTIDGWHIDHIKPLSSFDLADRKQLKEACHYSNLQPLWAEDNLRKSASL